MKAKTFTAFQCLNNGWAGSGSNTSRVPGRLTTRLFPTSTQCSSYFRFLSGFMEPNFLTHCSERETSVVKCWQIFWNINELMDLTAPFWIAVCRSSCIFTYFMHLGEERWTGKSQDPQWDVDPALLWHCLEQWAHPSRSLSFLIWKRTVFVCTFFCFVQERYQYFVWKSFVKGPKDLNLYY